MLPKQWDVLHGLNAMHSNIVISFFLLANKTKNDLAYQWSMREAFFSSVAMLFVCTRIIFIYYGFQKTCVHLALKNSLILFGFIMPVLKKNFRSCVILAPKWYTICTASTATFAMLNWTPKHYISQLITARFLREGLGCIFFCLCKQAWCIKSSTFFLCTWWCAQGMMVWIQISKCFF